MSEAVRNQRALLPQGDINTTLAERIAAVSGRVDRIESQSPAILSERAITLLSSWVAYASTHLSATLWSCADFMFADGVIKSGSTGDTAPIFYLPGGAVPGERQIVSVISNSAIGTVNMPYWGGYVSARTGSATWYSLNGCRVPLGGWQPLTLLNSWTQYSTGTMPGYAIDRFGILSLKGFIGGGTSGANVSSLSIGAPAVRSTAHIYATVANDAFGRVDILSDGGIKHVSGSNTWLALNNITMPLHGTWTAPTFTNSWVNYGTVSLVAYANAAYWKDPTNIVHLDGVIKSGTINTSAFTLPEGFRPAHKIWRLVASNDAVGLLAINPDGTVVPEAGSNVYVSLCGIKFVAQV